MDGSVSLTAKERKVLRGQLREGIRGWNKGVRNHIRLPRSTDVNTKVPDTFISPLGRPSTHHCVWHPLSGSGTCDVSEEEAVDWTCQGFGRCRVARRESGIAHWRGGPDATLSAWVAGQQAVTENRQLASGHSREWRSRAGRSSATDASARLQWPAAAPPTQHIPGCRPRPETRCGMFPR